MAPSDVPVTFTLPRPTTAEAHAPREESPLEAPAPSSAPPAAGTDAGQPPPAGTPGAAPEKQRRGFAALSHERRREVSKRGGIAAHYRGAGHEWDPEEARAAGRKGGLAKAAKARAAASHDPTVGPELQPREAQR